jgi:hypothetical protein
MTDDGVSAVGNRLARHGLLEALSTLMHWRDYAAVAG